MKWYKVRTPRAASGMVRGELVLLNATDAVYYDGFGGVYDEVEE